MSCDCQGRENIPACCVTFKGERLFMKRRTKEIKQQAKKALQGHCGIVIMGLIIVYGLNFIGTSLSGKLFSGTSPLDFVLSEVFMLVVSLLVGIVSAGFGYMLLNISRGRSFSIGDLAYFFKNQPDRVIVAGFVMALIQVITALPYFYISIQYTPKIASLAAAETMTAAMMDEAVNMLGTLLGLLALSVVLNFVFTIPLSMTYYLMADDPDLGGIQGLKESVKLMKGNIWRYLKLNLSFVPLIFLSAFTLYIALLWVLPYMEMSMATFYRDLNGELDHRLPGNGSYGGYENENNYGYDNDRDNDYNAEA